MCRSENNIESGHNFAVFIFPSIGTLAVTTTNHKFKDNKTNNNSKNASHDFSIGSLNVRGINMNIKRNAIFTWAKEKGFDILFLQECYCSTEIENIWQQEWDGKITFAHGSMHSRGTTILFSNKLDYSLIEEVCDMDGRYVICKIEVQGELYFCLNLYAPNSMVEKQIFFCEN